MSNLQATSNSVRALPDHVILEGPRGANTGYFVTTEFGHPIAQQQQHHAHDDQDPKRNIHRLVECTKQDKPMNPYHTPTMAITILP